MKLAIEGMHCQACVRRVTQALERSNTGSVEHVGIGEATLAAPDTAAPAVLAALEKAGYPARVAS
jgi:copper chaperone